jgi:toxin ParE1/3/4
MTSSRKLRLSPEAEEDLTDILAYTIRTWGHEQAIAYRATLYRALGELVDFPSLGRARDEFGAGTRSHVAGQHVIIYRVTDDEIAVSRIIHVRRDIERELRE